jgi:hypothetical protein
MLGAVIAMRSIVGAWIFGEAGLAVCTGIPWGWPPVLAGMLGSAGRVAVLAGVCVAAGTTGAVGPFT